MGKLSLWIGLDHNAFIDPGGYFDRHYNPKWLEDDFVKEIIWDVDNSIVNGPYSIISPALGNISPFMLSTGCKVTILLYVMPDDMIMIDMTNLGQNCMYFVSKILENKDLSMSTTTFLTTFTGLPVNGICENDGEEFHNYKELNRKLAKYLEVYPERNAPEFESDKERRLNGFYTKSEIEEMRNGNNFTMRF